MAALNVHLFGKFAVEPDTRPVSALSGAKVQELFSYLLLRPRPHPRETLTTLLWPEVPAVQAKRYLRKTVWQLQVALGQLGLPSTSPVLRAENEWLQVSADSGLWLDVAEFERAYQRVEDLSGEEMDAVAAAQVETAVRLYRGDLLEGWYQEWCLFERERLERMYLALLDKLVNYCAAHERYEAGIAYGTCALRHDPARERTHRRLMRLHALAGSRSEVMHQYALCVATLRDELGVTPSERTNALYHHLLLTTAEEAATPPARPAAGAQPAAEAEVNNTLLRLEQMLHLLGETQQLVQRNMTYVAATLDTLRRQA